MLKEERGFGETISEAIEDARAKLGVGIDDEVQFETITSPKKKVLGIFGGCKAEVRAYIEIPDKKQKKDNKKPVKKQNTVKETQNKKANLPEKKTADEKTETAPKAAEETVQKAQTVKPNTVEEDYKDAVDEALIDKNSPTGRAIEYLKSILVQLGCENITFKAAVKENGAFIIIDGDSMGTIIGHRGETLDALQYLSSLAANIGNGYFKISLNIGNYREKREETLVALAKKVSEQVIKNGRSRSLEPMNPYERRIIHTAVQEIDGVVSNSIGEGPRRHVIISPEGSDTRPQRRDNRRRGSRERKPTSVVSSDVTREPKKDSDVPLYGKIN